MHNSARSIWQLLLSVKRQTRKGTKKVIECYANTCDPLGKVLKMLVKFGCEHMKACQSRRSVKFSKKHMAALQVNDEATRKGT